jgi:hypothetical protein
MKTLVIHPKDKTTDFLKPIYHGKGYTVVTGGCTKEDVTELIDQHDHIIMLGHGTPQGLLAMNQFNGKPKPFVPKATVKPSTALRNSAEAIISGGKVTKQDIKDFYAPSTLPVRSPVEQEFEDDWFSSRQVGGGGYKAPTSFGFSGLSTGYVIDDKNAEQLKGKKLTAIWCNADQYMEWNELDGFYSGMFISDTGEATMIGTADTEQWQVEESNYGFVDVVRQFEAHDSKALFSAVMSHYGKMATRNAVAKYNLKRLYCHKNSEVSRKALESA